MSTQFKIRAENNIFPKIIRTYTIKKDTSDLVGKKFMI